MTGPSVPQPSTGEALLARQALYDRRGTVVGYELLFHDARDEAGAIDPDRSSFEVVLTALTVIGLGQLVGASPAHIRVSRRFLLEQHALVLPADRVVLEVVAGADADPALTDVLARLAQQGYRIALVTPFPSTLQPEQLRSAQALKVAVTVAGGPSLEARVEGVVGGPRTLIAHGVDRHEDAELCTRLGFGVLEGRWLSVPDLVRGRHVASAALAHLATIAGLYAPDASFEDIERIIAHDAGLSYRFLRYVNSAFFAMPRRVSSVREAMSLLGARPVRRWATLLVMSEVPGKPNELLMTALLRGRMCEHLARTTGEDDPERFFTAGLLSVMDALLDMPMTEVVGALPLTDDTSDALVHHRGAVGTILAAALSYEDGDFDAALDTAPPGAALGAGYADAVAYAGDASGGL